MSNDLLDAFPSEHDLSQKDVPTDRGAVYVMATEGADAGDVQILYVDDATNAFFPEALPTDIGENSEPPIEAAAAATVLPPPRSKQHVAVLFGTVAASVLVAVAASLTPPLLSSDNTSAITNDRLTVTTDRVAYALPAIPPPTTASSIPSPTPRPALVTTLKPAHASSMRERPAAPAAQRQPSRTVAASRLADSRTEDLAHDIADVSEPVAAPAAPASMTRASDVSAPTVSSRAEDPVEPRLASAVAVAVAPATERSAPPLATSENLTPIRELLTRYRAAYEALDARSAKHIWPSVDERALARAFDGLNSQTVTFDACDLAVSGARASVSCRGSASYVTRIGNRSVHTAGRQWNFQMQKSADQWQIASVQTR